MNLFMMVMMTDKLLLPYLTSHNFWTSGYFKGWVF